MELWSEVGVGLFIAPWAFGLAALCCTKKAVKGNGDRKHGAVPSSRPASSSDLPGNTSTPDPSDTTTPHGIEWTIANGLHRRFTPTPALARPPSKDTSSAPPATPGPPGTTTTSAPSPIVLHKSEEAAPPEPGAVTETSDSCPVPTGALITRRTKQVAMIKQGRRASRGDPEYQTLARVVSDFPQDERQPRVPAPALKRRHLLPA